MKEYLGDGVYIEILRGQVILTTENGLSTTNRIVFEPETLMAFREWLLRATAKGI